MRRQESFDIVVPGIYIDRHVWDSPGFRITQTRLDQPASVAASRMQTKQVVDFNMCVGAMKHDHSDRLANTSNAQQHRLICFDQAADVIVGAVDLAPL
jgi:hypothetical protein